MSNPYYGGAPPGGDPNQPQYGHGTPQQQFAGAGYQQNLYGQPPNPAYGQPSPGIPPPPQSGPYSPAGGPPGMGLPSPGGYLGQPGYGVDAMTAQMGQMGVQDPHGVPPLTPGAGPPPPGAAAHRTTRKKQRAYHELDQAPAVQPAPPIVPSPNAGLYSGTQPPQPQFASPTTASPPQFASSQFVTPANAGLQPANQPANIAEYGANMRGPGGNGRVDPDSIPSVPASRQAATLHYKTTVYPTVEQHLPPPAATDFIAIDQGNSSPKYIRLTLNTIPTTAELLNSTALPLGLTIQPLAAQKPEELPVPVLDFGDEGPPRCRRCRTYINPFMAFSANGAKFVCNMCSFPNEVPSTYYSPLDMTGKRVDREQRPELMRGTVEFTVPKEYWEKEPTPLRWLFALDVSMEAVNKGLIASTCRAIQRAIYGEEGEENSDENVETARKLPKGAKIAILTYDKEVHFYNLSANLDQAQMLVMTDLEDPFVPLSEGLFVDPYQSEKVIKSLLSSLPNLFANIKNAEPALLPTLTAALTALEGSGGKIVCSLSALPTWGPGRLHYREDSKMLGSDKERALFSTEHQSWKKLAKQMAENNVGIDFFVTPSAYIDVAAVGHLSAVTGGELFFYPNFTAERDSPKLEQELIHTVHRETGYQALMKVRCSNGLQVSAYHGNFLLGKQGGDINLSVIDQDKAFAVTFVYDGKLDPKLDAHFQSALLYTTATGERRVRCHNICAAVTEVAKEGLRFVDQDAVITALAKEAADMMVHKPLQTVRGFLTEKCVDILAAYRKNFSGGSPPGQLVLPEALKEFGLYILCLLKTRAFRGGNVASDMRVHAMRLIKSMGPAELSLFLYPRIIALHNLADEDCFPDESGHLRIPESLRASFSRTEEGGVYLVDNGQICLLWIHAQVSPNLLMDLFGPDCNSLDTLNPYLSEIPVLETLLNAQVRNLIEYLKTTRGSKALRVQLARQGLDGAEYEFASLLVEDRNNEAQSYVDWLVHVHRQIQLEVTGQRKKEVDTGEGGVISAAMGGLRPNIW